MQLLLSRFVSQLAIFSFSFLSQTLSHFLSQIVSMRKAIIEFCEGVLTLTIIFLSPLHFLFTIFYGWVETMGNFLRTIFGILSVISYLTSGFAFILHGNKHGKRKEPYVYHGTAGGMGTLLFIVLLWRRSSVAPYFGKRPAIVLAANGKQLNLLGPFLSMLIGWLFSECKVLEKCVGKSCKPSTSCAPISNQLFVSIFSFNNATFIIIMVLMPVNTDFRLLNSSVGLLFGLILRDFKKDRVKFSVTLIVLCVFMYVKDGYDTYLAKRVATALPVQILTASEMKDRLRAENQNLRERVRRADTEAAATIEKIQSLEHLTCEALEEANASMMEAMLYKCALDNIVEDLIQRELVEAAAIADKMEGLEHLTREALEEAHASMVDAMFLKNTLDSITENANNVVEDLIQREVNALLRANATEIYAEEVHKKLDDALKRRSDLEAAEAPNMTQNGSSRLSFSCGQQSQTQ